MASSKSFSFSEEPEPHKARTKQILAKHPDVRQLIGKTHIQFFAILFVWVQWSHCRGCWKDSSWWLMLFVVYCVGAFTTMLCLCWSMNVRTIFCSKRKAGIILLPSLPICHMVLPSGLIYPLSSYASQLSGHHDWDADLPDFWEARIFGNNFFSKALWFFLFPFFQLIRTFRLKTIKPVDSWIVTNWLVQFAFDAAIWILWGPQAFCFASEFFLFCRLHPLGARWIQEHYLTLMKSRRHTAIMDHWIMLRSMLVFTMSTMIFLLYHGINYLRLKEKCLSTMNL